jgi:SAM-dependent methyltransferase
MPAPDLGDQSWFLRGWRTYRKFLDLNYMFHREVYACLRGVLIAEAPPGFRFLDVACGDAAASVTALAGTDIGSYAGIDISRPALDLATVELAVLRCPVTLIERDFAGALADWKDPVDVVWIGQSLHHLSRDGKQAVARDVRRILGPGGQFLIWEPTSLPGEDRSGWADRVAERGSALWPEFDDEERETVVAHCRASDYPETADWWLSLRQAAGFSEARDLLEAPPGLGRVYAFTT